jgi:hypothetical protein
LCPGLKQLLPGIDVLVQYVKVLSGIPLGIVQDCRTDGLHLGTVVSLRICPGLL